MPLFMFIKFKLNIIMKKLLALMKLFCMFLSYVHFNFRLLISFEVIFIAFVHLDIFIVDMMEVDAWNKIDMMDEECLDTRTAPNTVI